jgi:hypothetical protein
MTYFLALGLPLGVLFASTALFLIGVGDGPFSFFCNGDVFFAGFTPLKNFEIKIKIIQNSCA